MKQFFVLLLPLIILYHTANAQFNDTIHHRVYLSSSGNFNRTIDGVTYLLNNNLKYSVRKKSFVMNAAGAWVYGHTPETLTNNDVTAAVDFNLYNLHISLPRWYYWGLINFTSSYSLKIKEQMQTGLGVAYRFIEKPNIMLSVSDGILFERSNVIQEDGTELGYQTFRNSLRVQFRYKYKELLTLNGTGFYQPSLQYGGDFIINLNAGLGIKIWRWLSFNTAVTYNEVSRTQRENLQITYGLVAEHFF